MGIGGSEFYAGEVVTSLIGFTNKGSAVFIVTGIEASFRYPQDFSYHIQNVRVSICVCSHVGHPCVWGGGGIPVIITRLLMGRDTCGSRIGCSTSA